MDCLVFSCSHRGRTRLRLLQQPGQAGRGGRDAVIAGIKRLVAAELIAKHKQSRLVQWRYGGQAWRQMPNAYRILAAPNCESDFPTALKELGKKVRLAVEESGRGWRACRPVRTVAEQLAILLNGSGTRDSAK